MNSSGSKPIKVGHRHGDVEVLEYLGISMNNPDTGRSYSQTQSWYLVQCHYACPKCRNIYVAPQGMVRDNKKCGPCARWHTYITRDDKYRPPAPTKAEPDRFLTLRWGDTQPMRVNKVRLQARDI